MTRILFVNKSDTGIGTPTEEVLQLFENSDDMEEIKSSVENAAERLLVTWASVDIKDKAGEKIPIEDIIEQQETLLKRNGPVSDTHTNKIIGQTIAFKVLEHPKSKTLGVLHLQRFFDDYDIDNQIWSEIVSGERTGSSVGGYRQGVKQGYDEVTDEPVVELQDFTQLETASVVDPCNPLALNEAFSVVAKSNSTKVSETYAGFDTLKECIEANEGVEDDPKSYCEMKMETVKTIQICVPCNSEKEETVINKQSDKDNITMDSKKNIEGDNMKKDVIKTISEMATAINKIAADVTLLKKQAEEEPEPVEEKKQDEEPEEVVVEEPEEVQEKKTSKADDDEDKEDEEEVDKEDDDDDDEVDKEEAASDIDGESDAGSPEPVKPEDSNEEDSFKELEKKMVAKINAAVKKATTPHPGALDVNKANKFANLPLDIAMGEKKISFKEANKLYSDHLTNMRGGL